METIFSLNKEKILGIVEKECRLREVLQKIALCALSRNNFFAKADFMGGTALRMYYGLPRFSEDLDFTLKKTDTQFDIDRYCAGIAREFDYYGINCEVVNLSKPNNPVRKLNIKFNQIEMFKLFFPGEEFTDIRPNAKFRVKVEVATISPDFACREAKESTFPVPHTVSVLDLPTLFAGKLSALITRQFNDSSVKGRDMFDYLFLIDKNITPNIPHLKSRLCEAGVISDSDSFNSKDLCLLLHKHFKDINYKSAISDVSQFISDEYYIKYAIKDWNEQLFNGVTTNRLAVLAQQGFMQIENMISGSLKTFYGLKIYNHAFVMPEDNTVNIKETFTVQAVEKPKDYTEDWSEGTVSCEFYDTQQELDNRIGEIQKLNKQQMQDKENKPVLNTEKQQPAKEQHKRTLRR